MIAALCPASGGAPARAAAGTAIAVDGAAGGRTFDTVGATSGGGGNTRLRTDCPAAQQRQIFDCLCTPGYGADLQILKVEIGGDTDSTDGSESSHERTAGVADCGTCYEWWLMEQARARNPAVGLRPGVGSARHSAPPRTHRRRGPLTAAVDGAVDGHATDTAYRTGVIELGTDGYRTDQFDNPTVTPATPAG
ncbi:hypothetical protein [Actinacidiphila sp. ITFR-21]|uniref:hypothetical protein n=1 Tax=Actinacidiphila sp. ITFR-21 TaxID=3075199 RepID=UPI00288B20C4|nr:hypothetical protein [Streptomyces sp. ITFR-21]WNI14123.1 hypothetical protein RLT57_00330 [Streptomyces sp. ITFR-21]